MRNDKSNSPQAARGLRAARRGCLVSAMTPAHDKPARDLLDFYQEAGVDALLGEEPVNRFAAAEPPAPPPRAAQPVALAARPRNQGPRRARLAPCTRRGRHGGARGGERRQHAR